MIPVPIIVKSLADWSDALEGAEADKDWGTVKHTRLSMQQAVVILRHRLDQKAQAEAE